MRALHMKIYEPTKFNCTTYRMYNVKIRFHQDMISYWLFLNYILQKQWKTLPTMNSVNLVKSKEKIEKKIYIYTYLCINRLQTYKRTITSNRYFKYFSFSFLLQTIALQERKYLSFDQRSKCLATPNCQITCNRGHTAL